MIDNDGITATDGVKRRIQFTEPAKRSHVQSFASSTETMSAYCKKHNIAVSTFSGWVSKYSKKQQQTAFVPVRLPNKPAQAGANKPQGQPIEIHRGDLKVIFPVMNDISMMIDVIREVLSCN